MCVLLCSPQQRARLPRLARAAASAPTLTSASATQVTVHLIPAHNAILFVFLNNIAFCANLSLLAPCSCCTKGYFGVNCQIECFPERDCFGNGYCTSTAQCVCYPGSSSKQLCFDCSVSIVPANLICCFRRLGWRTMHLPL